MTDAADLATATSPVTPAVSTWEDPRRGEPADGAPVLSIDGFAGPLDWLLEMARAKKIDLARLSIGALIEAFSRAMQAALAGRDRGRIGHWAAWTVMAATLTELRSRLLLPADAPAARAAAEEAEALRRQLLARAQMRLAADWLERRPQLGREVFARGSPELSPSGRVGDLTELPARLPGGAACAGGAGGRLSPPAAAVVAGQRRAGAPASAARASARRQPAAGLPAATWLQGTGQRVARPRGALQHADRRPGTGAGRRARLGAGRGVDARSGSDATIAEPETARRKLPWENYPRAWTSSRSCSEDAGRGRAGPRPARHSRRRGRRELRDQQGQEEPVRPASVGPEKISPNA